MSNRVTFTYLDFSGEKSSWSCVGTDLSGANFDAQQALVSNLQTAANGLLQGTLNKTTQSIIEDGSGTLPASATAQREVKILASYTDNVTGRSYNSELPCPDFTIADIIQGTDVLDLTETASAAFKVAFEAFARAPATGNAVTLNSLRLVGRRV